MFEDTTHNLCTLSATTKTKGSSLSASTTTSCVDNSPFLAAIIEGRGYAKGEVGLAVYNLKSPVVYLYQFTDNLSYLKLITKLNIIDPLEIILPNTICDMGQSKRMLQQISENCLNLRIAYVDRKYFNDQKGMQSIKKLRLADGSTFEFQVASRYYCLAACNALLGYVEFIQKVEFSPASLKFLFKENAENANLDLATVRSIELLRNNVSSRNQYSLFGILNNTKTNMGARLLRSNLLEPLTDLNTLNDRLDLVEEFLENSNLYHKIRYAIGRFPDIEHLLTILIHIPKIETMKSAENKLSTLISLKSTLESVDLLKDALHCSKCDLMKTFFNILCDQKLNFMLGKISAVICNGSYQNKNVFTTRVLKGFAIKPKINDLLDVSRRTYSEVIDDINQLVKQLSEKYNLALKSGYSASRGFYLHTAANNNKLGDLPVEFLKPLRCKNSFIFTTYELMSFNERIKDSLNEIYILSGRVADMVLHEIRVDVSILHRIAESIAILDMLSCFAFNCINSNSKQVRPKFANTLVIKSGRHPILEKMFPVSCVPNATYASDSRNVAVIEGPNMSGKSTYLSQIVLLQILAQIGSFVPAEDACFRISEWIFTRIGRDIEANVDISSFMSEMKKVNYILQNATCSSLIVIDELCGGTSAKESIALCLAMYEFLSRTKAFAFLVTHYKHLVSQIYLNAENYHFKIVLSGDYDVNHVIYTYMLTMGKMTYFNYGIHLAKISTLYKRIPNDASQIHKIIETYKKRCQREANCKRSLYRLFKSLEVICDNGYTNEFLKRKLISLKANCIMK